MNTLISKNGKFIAEVELAAPPVVTKGKKIARFELSYFKGQRARGIHVWLRTLEVEQHENYTTETFELYGGRNISMYLKILPRKNDKQLALAAEKLEALVPEVMAAFTDVNRSIDEVKALLGKMSEVIA